MNGYAVPDYLWAIPFSCIEPFPLVSIRWRELSVASLAAWFNLILPKFIRS